ncbi:MAG: hypothetical protein ACTHLW_21115 [Verrucomicrobiota bacterium]
MNRKFLILLSATAVEGGAGKPDQVDILALNTKLTSDLATAQTSLSALTADKATLEAKLSAANASIQTLTTERDTARTQLATAQSQVTSLTESQKNFDGRLAAELAKNGIRAKAIDAEETGKTKTKLTLTERCLAASGK